MCPLLYTLSGVTYTTPATEGYCGFENIIYAPEMCFCDADTQNYQSDYLCKSHCDNDRNCKGYDYMLSHGGPWGERCRFFTTSSCPGACIKMNIGRTGNIVNKPFVKWSGCFIKTGTIISFTI